MKAVSKYDKELCEGWNKDVDSALVFVSAIPTRSLVLFMITSSGWFVFCNSHTVCHKVLQMA